MNEISNKCLFIKIIKKYYSAKYYVIGLTNNFRNICCINTIYIDCHAKLCEESSVCSQQGYLTKPRIFI